MSTARIGDVEIAYDDHGPGDGRVAVLIHGFPDTGRVWDAQVDALVGAGYRVLVPDMRGYGRSSKPAEVADYHLLALAGDVLAVLDTAGVERAALVGHDWGAAVTWALASFSPDRAERAAVLSVGHPAAFRNAGLPQREKSWYMLLFQFPGIAERWLTDDGWANFRAWAQHPDADAVIADLERDASLTTALNWYRANIPPSSLVDPAPVLPPVTVPVLGVWSSGDMALLEEQMRSSAQHCTAGFRYERIDDAGHWVQLDAPKEINELLVDFLS